MEMRDVQATDLADVYALPCDKGWSARLAECRAWRCCWRTANVRPERA